MTKCSHVEMGGREVTVCDADVDSSVAWASAIHSDPAKDPANLDEVCVRYSKEQLTSPQPTRVFNRFAESVESYVAGRGSCNDSGQTDIERLKKVAISDNAAGDSAAIALYKTALADPELAQECVAGLGEAAEKNYTAVFHMTLLADERPELASQIIQKLGEAATVNVLAAKGLRDIALFHPEFKKDVGNALNFALNVVKCVLAEVPSFVRSHPERKAQVEEALQKKAYIAEYVGSALNEL